MIKLSGKIISLIVGLAVVGTGTAAAAVVSSQNIQQATVSSETSEESIAGSSASSTVGSAVSSAASSAVSSAVSSSAPAPKNEGVSNVDDGVEAIQKATNDGVSQIKQATNDGVSAIQSKQQEDEALRAEKAARLQREKEEERWPVIDPKTGYDVSPNNPKYEQIRAELGGDAGLVNPDKSTACQAALQKLKEAREKERSSSSVK